MHFATLIVVSILLFGMLHFLVKLCYNVWAFYQTNRELDRHISEVFRDVRLIEEGRSDEIDPSDDSYERFVSLMERYTKQKNALFG